VIGHSCKSKGGRFILKLLKQAGTVVVASALLFSYVPQVWAAEAAGASGSQAMPIKEETKLADVKISKEKALELAKSYITLPDGYTLQSVNLNSYRSYEGSNAATWYLSYTKKVQEQYYGNLNIVINATNGKLASYSFGENDPDHKVSYPPKVDYKGAKEAAAKWIAKINPDVQNQLIYNERDEKSFRAPLNGNYQYNIRYDRAANGVPFPQNGIMVSVNGDGVITGYNYNWDDAVTFDKNEGAITKEKAAQAFKEKAEVSLVYQTPYEMKGDKKPVITYGMNTSMLDAVTGELWNPGNYPVPADPNAKPLTEKPLAEKSTASLNLTKEQAMEKVNAVLPLPEGVSVEDASYNEYTNPDNGESTSTWNLRWSQAASKDPKGKIDYSINAAVNSRTGEILNYNRYNTNYNGQDKDIEAKVSSEAATAQAVEFVKKNLPAYTDQLVLANPMDRNLPIDQVKKLPNWDINFKRVIDGVSASYESVNVSIDKVTGEIVNYYANLSTLPYPQTKPEVLPLEKAKDLLLSQYDIQLSYVTAGNNYGNMPIEKYKVMIAAGEMVPPVAGENQKLQAKLVYSLVPKYTQDSFFLDAVSGQWKNASTGEVITLEKVKVNDIEGHWAQNELQLMVDYQALDVQDGKVSPNKAITRGEMIKMLVIAMNGGNNGIKYAADRAASFADVKQESPYFAYVENAVDRGLLDRGKDLNPNAVMTREEQAQLIVRALGYKTLTKYDGVFNQQFQDASKLKNVGEVAIVVGLEIMSLNEGSFQPEQEVTRAQAATAFFRYLQKRAELQDVVRPYY
jgi:hypothetical protein